MVEGRPGGAGDTVEKLMSLDDAEFARSLARLGLEAMAINSNAYLVPLSSDGTVTITVNQVDGATLGGLLKLPRRRVVLQFQGVSPSERGAFLARFDRAFQRGGG